LKLPLLLSVPHAGVRVPAEVQPYCILTPEQIVADGDVGAAEVYDLEDEVEAYITTDVARAIVDVNRAAEDRRRDGVVKTHTCWDEPVYDPFPPEDVIAQLLERYYHPYHARLARLATPRVIIGIDCHTMAAAGPPVGPDPGKPRPAFCLSNAGRTCPPELIETLATILRDRSGLEVSINKPFRGGFIIRSHAWELEWIQLEMSRAPFMANREKRDLVGQALREFCSSLFG
jgi:formiminoglutamase